MDRIKQIPIFGSFNADETPVFVMAYSNSAWIQRVPLDNGYKKMPGWYIMTNAKYVNPRTGTAALQTTEELIFTPFYSGKYRMENEIEQPDPAAATDSLSDLLHLFAVGATEVSCSPDNMSGNNYGVPLFQYNYPNNYNFTTNQGYYQFATQNNTPIGMRPSVIKLRSLKDGGFNIVNVADGTNVNCVNGFRNSASPYDAISIVNFQGFIENSDGKTSTVYNIESLFGSSDDVLINSPILYAGYPYRITSTIANVNTDIKPPVDGSDSYPSKGSPISPFRNFVQTEACAENSIGIPQRWVSAFWTNSGNLEFAYAQTLGANYDNLKYSQGNDEQGFNWYNQQLKDDYSNIDNTVQFYFIPLQYYQSIVKGQCTSFGDPTSKTFGQFALDNIISPLYFNKLPNCNAGDDESPCFFSDANSCQLGFWQNYCIDSTTTCGSCFGRCPQVDVSGQFCRISNAATSSKPFTCGGNPNPEPPQPPAPPTPEEFWQRNKGFIIGGIIGLGVFVVFALLMSAAIAKKNTEN
jgi:hypothetical protein